ncbi:unnamed protein product [Cylicostephanus goldi]|uniref:Uncharacterized protein n=1 Tax=Cylicostephanus goldi TaxID=71465 RepID=A0A3P6QNG4_CYLGO|nr:unnamed protein product [Cylicostephanus goldi]
MPEFPFVHFGLDKQIVDAIHKSEHEPPHQIRIKFAILIVSRVKGRDYEFVFLHRDMLQNERNGYLQPFRKKVNIMVTTDVAGEFVQNFRVVWISLEFELCSTVTLQGTMTHMCAGLDVLIIQEFIGSFYAELPCLVVRYCCFVVNDSHVLDLNKSTDVHTVPHGRGSFAGQKGASYTLVTDNDMERLTRPQRQRGQGDAPKRKA